MIQLRIPGLGRNIVDGTGVHVVSSKKGGGGRDITWMDLGQRSEYFFSKGLSSKYFRIYG